MLSYASDSVICWIRLDMTPRDFVRNYGQTANHYQYVI